MENGVGNRAERANSLDQRRIHHRAVFQPVAGIAARHLALQSLVNAQHDVDRRIAIGVRADLPSGLVRFARVRVQLLFAVHQNAVIVRPSHVRLGKPRRALGDGSVAHQLDGAHAEPLIAEPGANARGRHPIEKLVLQETIDAKRELARLARVLIGQQVFGSAFGVVHRGHAGAHHHLRDQLDALAHFVARELRREQLPERLGGVLAQASGEASAGRVAIEFAARRDRQSRR